LALNSNSAHAYFNQGTALFYLRDYHAAIASIDKAVLLDPKSEYVSGFRLYLKRILCNWKLVDEQLKQLEEQIEKGERATAPFNFAVMSASTGLQRRAADLYVQDKYGESAAKVDFGGREKHEKIRISYYSAEFHNYATCYLIAGLVEQHDRKRFELVAFSFGPDAHD